MTKNFISLLAATVAIGIATLFAQESGTESNCGLGNAECGMEKGVGQSVLPRWVASERVLQRFDPGAQRMLRWIT
jgi:hypothetical protein